MGGHSQPRPRSADWRRRSAGRGATASAPATCATRAMSGRAAISCPATPKVSRTRRTCHQHPHSALKTRPPTDGSNATTGRTLEAETPSGYAFASVTTPWRTRPPICGRWRRAVRRSRHHAAPTRGKGAAPPCATLHTGARFSGGSKGGGSQPLASPGVLHGVGWLDHRSVAQASFGTPPKHLSGHRPKLHPPGHRRQAPRPVGRQPHERRGGRGRPDRWRRSLPRRPVSALPGTPPGPEFVDPGRSCGP